MKFKAFVVVAALAGPMLLSPAAKAAGNTPDLGGIFNGLNAVVAAVPLGSLGTLANQSLHTYHLDFIPVIGAVGGTITPSEGLFVLQSILSAQQPVIFNFPGAIQGLPALPGLPAN